jgi:hypothetical protein
VISSTNEQIQLRQIKNKVRVILNSYLRYSLLKNKVKFKTIFLAERNIIGIESEIFILALYIL